MREFVNDYILSGNGDVHTIRVIDHVELNDMITGGIVGWAANNLLKCGMDVCHNRKKLGNLAIVTSASRDASTGEIAVEIHSEESDEGQTHVHAWFVSEVLAKTVMAIDADVVSLEYKHLGDAMQIVEVAYRNGYVRKVNVTGDGLKLITVDVIRFL